MAGNASWSYEAWFDGVLAIAARWSVQPDDVDSINESFFYGSFQRGDSPEQALIDGLASTSQPMDIGVPIAGREQGDD